MNHEPGRVWHHSYRLLSGCVPHVQDPTVGDGVETDAMGWRHGDRLGIPLLAWPKISNDWTKQ
jgi:hypothetical protein